MLHASKDPLRCEEWKKKISYANTGRVVSEETRKKISLVHKGKPKSEETRRKMSEASKNRSPEYRKKISAKMMGNKNGLGHHPTPEVLMKRSLKLKGHRVSEEGRAKLRILRLGTHLPEEVKKKISESSKGEKSCHWKGGISYYPYCPKFTKEFKERVRTFFNNVCQCCGHIWKKNEERLLVHHVNYDKMVCCNSVKPLFVPLCRPCHSRTIHNREYWEEVFTNKIMLEYDGECYISKTGDSG